MKQDFLIFLDFTKKLLFRDRSTIMTMVRRDLRAQYVGSIFGFLWAVIEPLSQLAVYGIFFGILLKSQVDPVYGTDSFFLYLLCGLIPWQFFAQSVNSSTTAIVANSNLVRKAVAFPSEILTIIKVLTNIISHLIGMVLLLVIVAVFKGFTPLVPLFFVYLFFAALFAVGIGWVLASANVYLKDIQKVMGVVMMAWFFFTPIFYSPSIVPQAALPFIRLNPMYHVVVGYRYAILAGKFLPWQDFLYLAVVSSVTFGIGGIFFRRLKPGFAEVL